MYMWCYLILCRDGTGQDFFDLTQPVNFKIYRSNRFFSEGFRLLINEFNEKFLKGVLKFVTPDGGLRKKKQKKFAFFCKNNSILRPF